MARRELNLELPPLPPDVETLGGYILTQLGEAPVPGDTVATAGYRFRVLEVRDRRIRRLRGEPLPKPPRRIPTKKQPRASEPRRLVGAAIRPPPTLRAQGQNRTVGFPVSSTRAENLGRLPAGGGT